MPGSSLGVQSPPVTAGGPDRACVGTAGVCARSGTDRGTDEEQEWIATTLARVHAAAHPTLGRSTATFALDWLSPQMPGMAAQPWLLAVIDAVRAETDPPTVTWSVLRTDLRPKPPSITTAPV